MANPFMGLRMDRCRVFRRFGRPRRRTKSSFTCLTGRVGRLRSPIFKDERFQLIWLPENRQDPTTVENGPFSCWILLTKPGKATHTIVRLGSGVGGPCSYSPCFVKIKLRVVKFRGFSKMTLSSLQHRHRA